MQVPLEIDTAILRPEQVDEALNLAGRIIGIGDYRPEKGGGFGRFSAAIKYYVAWHGPAGRGLARRGKAWN